MKNELIRYLILFTCISYLSAGCTAGYKNPPKDIDGFSLIGTWRTEYGGHQIDTIVISDDRTFIQRFEDTKNDYLFETEGEWYLERLSDGSVYLHLVNGRYYVAGITRAERDGRGLPCTQEFPDCWWENEPFLFYDPYSDRFVEMVDKLVLTIRVDYTGNIVLHHLCTSSDGAFAIIGYEKDIFYKME